MLWKTGMIFAERKSALLWRIVKFDDGRNVLDDETIDDAIVTIKGVHSKQDGSWADYDGSDEISLETLKQMAREPYYWRVNHTTVYNIVSSSN